MLTAEQHNLLSQLTQLGIQRLAETAAGALLAVAPPPADDETEEAPSPADDQN